MASAEECICCCKIVWVVAKLEDSGAPCITEHEGYDAICLNRWVSQTAYYQYKQRYGRQSNKPEVHEYVSHSLSLHKNSLTFIADNTGLLPINSLLDGTGVGWDSLSSCAESNKRCISI